MPMSTEQQRALSWLLLGLLVVSLITHWLTHQNLQYVCSFVPFLEEDELPTEKTKREERERVDRICNPSSTVSERE